MDEIKKLNDLNDTKHRNSSVSVFGMLVLFFDLQTVGIYLFGFSMLSLLISLGISFWEISISVHALRLYLSGLVDENK